MAIKNLDNNSNEIRAQITEALKEDNEGAIRGEEVIRAKMGHFIPFFYIQQLKLEKILIIKRYIIILCIFL